MSGDVLTLVLASVVGGAVLIGLVVGITLLVERVLRWLLGLRLWLRKPDDRPSDVDEKEAPND